MKDRMTPVFHHGRIVGYVWYSSGEWHGESRVTGMSWAGEFMNDMIQMVKDNS